MRRTPNCMMGSAVVTQHTAGRISKLRTYGVDGTVIILMFRHQATKRVDSAAALEILLFLDRAVPAESSLEHVEQDYQHGGAPDAADTASYRLVARMYMGT